MDRYAVFGNPINQTKSPQIHRWFAAQTGEAIDYQAQLVDLDGFVRAATAFFAVGGKGLNITIPFKQDAFNFADRLTERARRAGAVNTLAMQDDGSTLGDNTDGYGLVSDITENLGWCFSGKRVLVLGAGGAVRGVLSPIFAKSPAQLCIANRTASKAESLAQEFADLGTIRGIGLTELAAETTAFDLIINATSMSLSGGVPPVTEHLLAASTCVYDMVYGSEPTVFMDWASARGCVVSDGLGMLVGQAAESFYVWRGIRPKTQELIGELRASA